MKPYDIPSHWTPYVSDSGWFALSHPPTWQARRVEDGFLLQAPEGAARLSFRCLHLTVPAEGAPAINLAELAPRAESLERLPPLDLPYDHIGMQGSRAQFAKCFGVADDREWQLAQVWLIRHESLLLNIFFFEVGERDPELHTLARLVLSSLELADAPADPADVFTERIVAEARRRYPERAVEKTDVLTVRFGNAQLGLGNSYRQYIAAPHEFDALAGLLLERAEQLQAASPQWLSPALDDVRARIMPMLYPRKQWQQMIPQNVGTPWVGPLATLYVVDQPDTYWYIRQELLEQWSLSPPALHELAMHNLTAYWKAKPMAFQTAGSKHRPTMMLPLRRDSYNAVRFVCPQFRQEMLERFGRDFVLGLPSRDFFAAIAAAKREMIMQLRRQVASDYATSDHALTDRLLRVSEDGVSEYAT